MMPTTPSGTRILPTWMPDGRSLRSVISPTGSGRFAIWITPSAIAAMRSSLSCSRSSIAEREQARVLLPRIRPRDVAGGRSGPLALLAHVCGDRGVADLAGRLGRDFDGLRTHKRLACLQKTRFATGDAAESGGDASGGGLQCDAGHT